MGTITVCPSSYDETNSVVQSITSPENGLTASDSTTYATISLVTGASAETYSYYLFDLSSIPSSAEITSINCNVTMNYSSSAFFFTPLVTAQLFGCDVAKGEKFENITSSKKTFSLTCGDWTREELNNCKLKIYAQRSSSSSYPNANIDVYFYGATLTVTYIASPTITLQDPSKERISDKDSYDQCVCTFTSDLALSYWEARAIKDGTGIEGRGVGVLVESGELAEGAVGTIYIDNEELTNGDGSYVITVYGKSTENVWSDGTYEEPEPEPEPDPEPEPTTHTITFAGTGNANYTYVSLNDGTESRYVRAGTATVEDGTVITCYCNGYANQAINSKIYVDGEAVASRSYGAVSYNYTVTSDITIEFSSGNATTDYISIKTT